MDLMTGLSAVSQAVSIVKELREIDRSVDEATFKLKIADLAIALADTKTALADARTALLDKDTQISQLEARIADLSSGEICPVCNTSRLKTISVTPHPTFWEMGVQEKHLSCENEECNHSEKRMHDPTGLVDK